MPLMIDQMVKAHADVLRVFNRRPVSAVEMPNWVRTLPPRWEAIARQHVRSGFMRLVRGHFVDAWDYYALSNAGLTALLEETLREQTGGTFSPYDLVARIVWQYQQGVYSASNQPMMVAEARRRILVVPVKWLRMWDGSLLVERVLAEEGVWCSPTQLIRYAVIQPSGLHMIVYHQFDAESKAARSAIAQ